MDELKLEEKHNLKLFTLPSFNTTNLVFNAFTTKDFSLSSACEFLNIDISKLITPKQIHSNKAVKVIKQEDITADAVITNIPGIVLSVRVADCVPIFLLDKKRKAIGLIHAGWRGSTDKITRETIIMMRESFNTDPKDCLAVIGPSIGSCCYEVGGEVITRLKNSFFNCGDALHTKPDGKHMLDLKLLNKNILLECGIKPENITISSLCTSCRKDLFYSYRREGKTGRMFAFLMLKG